MHKVSYIGDGITTEFAFDFVFFQNADIHVALNNTENAQPFSVVPTINYIGGVIIFESAPPDGVQIDIYRNISLERVIDYQPTSKIEPECLNRDFNFLLAAFQDIYSVNIDLADWKNIHDNVLTFLHYINDLIADKLSGGGALGVYKNLVSVLESARPYLINDYGLITDPAPNENKDDYGVL